MTTQSPPQPAQGISRSDTVQPPTGPYAPLQRAEARGRAAFVARQTGQPAWVVYRGELSFTESRRPEGGAPTDVIYPDGTLYDLTANWDPRWINAVVRYGTPPPPPGPPPLPQQGPQSAPPPPQTTPVPAPGAAAESWPSWVFTGAVQVGDERVEMETDPFQAPDESAALAEGGRRIATTLYRQLTGRDPDGEAALRTVPVEPIGVRAAG